MFFREATRQQSKLRLTIDGPAGSGKSYTALRFAHALANGGRIAAIDTERGSLSKYVGDTPDGIPWMFDVLELTQFSPEKYTEAVLTAGRAGYTVLIIDSLSHAWAGVGGALEIKQKYGEAWSAWRHVTPIHDRMVDTILQSPLHVISTMRSRIEYVQETDDHGKIVIRKVGLAPIQRPLMEYEWDVVCDIDWAHIMTVSKSRCSAVDGITVEKPGPEFMKLLLDWLASGVKEKQYTPAATPVITLDSLVETYGIDAVLAANGNLIPDTDEKLASTADILAISVES